MKKLLKDTLTNPVTGRYSRKSITLFVSFGAAMFYEFVLPFIAFLINFEFQPSQYVFDGLLLFTASLFGITIADKKFENKGFKKIEE
jgi:hypothetical protein